MTHALRHRWRQDRLPLLLFLLVFLVMSYPFVLRMHDSLPIHNTDTFEVLAKQWSLRQALIHGKALDFSELLFYPLGLNITLQPQRWTAFPLWTALYTAFGDPLAYNLAMSLGIIFKAYGMYLFGLLLFRRRIPAWVTGAFYAFAAPALAMALRQPDTGATEWIPWLMLCLAHGLNRLRAANGQRAFLIMALAGLCFSINMYMHLRVAIFALLIGGAYICWAMFAQKLWARRQFWLALLLFALTAALTSAPLLLRTLRSDQYAYAVDRPVIDSGGAVDLLGFFKAQADRPFNYRQIIASLSGEQLEVECLCRGMSQMGIVAFVFALMGAIYILRFQREQAVWILLALAAFLLTLGITVHIGGHALGIYWTPYRLLQDNFFFRALWQPFRMILVFLFPFSLLIGYGVHSRLGARRLIAREAAVTAICLGALLYGTSIFPVAMHVSPRPPHLAALDNLPAGALIDLPMGRQEAKYYMALQRFHGRPLVEGMLPRTPPAAYDYIKANPVLLLLQDLSYWRRREPLSQDAWRNAIDQLLRDGFRYVVLHRHIQLEITQSRSLPGPIADLFFPATPIHRDDNVSIYDLAIVEYPFAPAGATVHERPPGSPPLDLRFGDHFVLHSWSLAGSHQVKPCQWVSVESWWRALDISPIQHSITLILSEADGDGQLAIGENVPADIITTRWQSGAYYRDQAHVFLPCSTPSGQALLLLGMKQTVYGDSLPIYTADDSPLGTLALPHHAPHQRRLTRSPSYPVGARR